MDNADMHCRKAFPVCLRQETTDGCGKTGEHSGETGQDSLTALLLPYASAVCVWFTAVMVLVRI